ncbi:MAG: sensor histidine kinase [Bradymonadia bacterium]
MVKMMGAAAAVLTRQPDQSWQIDEANAHWQKVWGRAEDAETPCALSDLLSPSLVTRWRSGLEDVEGRDLQYPWPATEQHMHVRFSPLHGVEGVPRCLVTVLTRPLGEETDYQQRYTELFESAPAMMHSIDAEGRLVHISDMWLQRLGYTRGEVLGRRSTELLTPESRRYAIEEVLPQYMITGRCESVPYQFVTKSGELVDVLLSATSEYDDDGRVNRSLAIIVDVTPLKRLTREREQALKAELESAALSHDILNAQSEMICRFLPDTTLLYTNEAYARIFGSTPTELVGRAFLDFIPAVDQAGTLNQLKLLGDPAGPGTMTYEHRALVHGHEVWQEWTDTAIFDTDGRVLEFQSIGRDVTERKLAETSLRESNEKLAQANADLEQFTRVAAHDLKAPLRGIKNLASWIEEDLGEQLTGEARDHFEHLVRRVGRLSALLDDLLAYARLGQRIDQVREVDILELAQEVVYVVDPPDAFTVQVVGETQILNTQTTPLSTALRNLVSNAIKHHDRGEGSIIVTVKAADGGCELLVEDDGPGIPEQYHTRIFEPFTTLKSRDEVEGSGMGLAIVKRLIELHGGHIHLEAPITQQGAPTDAAGRRGTRFTLYWPNTGGSVTDSRP